MSKIVEVRLPKYPECWSSCGNCASGDVTIDKICVLPGTHVARDQTIVVLETGKVALDIPSPCAGTVLSLYVTVGDAVEEFQLVMTVATA